MKRALASVLLLLAIPFAAAACGGSAGTNEGSPPEAAADPVPQETTAATPPPAPEGTGQEGPEDAAPVGPVVTTVGGDRVDLGAGDDVTALFFMAGW